MDATLETSLTEQQLREEVRRLAPFHHKIELPHGVSTHIPELAGRQVESTRIANLVKHAFPSLLEACGGSLKGKRVLDVACNCGGFSVEAAKLGAEYVLGVDIVDHYLEQARFIKRVLKLNQVEFRTQNIDTIEVETVGEFDVTFCFGILYHLENPAGVMRRLSAVTRRVMLVDTDVMPMRFNKKPYWLMNTVTQWTPDSKAVTTSRWRTEAVSIQFRPTMSAVVELLKVVGFKTVLTLKPHKDIEKRYLEGKRAAFVAIRD
ncbi:MAG TPA: methyltransferase domain-containing protein [Vicinamibacterales bacterium]|jgi:tRNA (mo5U34)-methyltransferase|nr:methyltransferase domain-containing protein [Vicinamibacterales bacterium]